MYSGSYWHGWKSTTFYSGEAMKKYLSCSIRTRTYAGIKMRIELSTIGGGTISNAITTVAKDSLILIIEE